MRRHWLLIHHGAGGARVFSTAKDYSRYEHDLCRLAHVHRASGIERVAAWCLVPGAALVVVTVSGNPARDEHALAQFMTHLALRHTVRLTGLAELPEVFWNNAVSAVLVPGDQLAQTCRFVELTSVRACLVPTPAGWEWSSYRYGGECRPVMPSKTRIPAWLTPRPKVTDSWEAFVNAGIGRLSRQIVDAGVSAGQVTYTRSP